MPPPVTPSPHRFVARRNQDRAPSQARPRPPPTHAPPPPSQGRSAAQQDAVTPSQQFKPTPRFSFARPNRPLSLPSTPRIAFGDGLSSQAHRASQTPDDANAVRLSRGPPSTLRKVESIHDASQEDAEGENSHGDDEEMLYGSVADDDVIWVKSVEGPPRNGLSAVHDADQGGQLSEGTQDALTPTTEQPIKRRRLTPSLSWTPKPDASAQWIDPLKRDSSVASPESPPRTNKVSRFRLPGQTPAPTPAIATELPTQSAGPRPRNPFRMPPTQAGLAGSEPIIPLPEHFSPHRRSQKFVPGGMADVVRGWILSVGHGGFQTETVSNQPGQRTDRAQRAGQPSKIRITGRSEENSGDRLKLIAGRSVRGPVVATEEDNCSALAVLIGPGKANSRSLKAGEDVVVAPPSWDVEVGQRNEKWLVAVDWHVT